MPIFDQGYQHWKGELSGHTWRWWTITRQGVRAQLKYRMTWMLLLMGLTPALALATALAIWGLIEQKSTALGWLVGFVENLPAEVKSGPEGFRVPIWTIAYSYFFISSLIVTMLLVTMVGPGLVSQDLRFNAMPLYFSRPLRRFDYFLGKLGVIGVFLGIVAIVPVILAWVLGVAFSLDLTVIRDTTPVMLVAVAYGGVIVVSAGTLMLAMSSLTRNSRYVAAMWLGIWLVTWVLGQNLVDALNKPSTVIVSYPSNLHRVGNQLLGTRSAYEKFAPIVVRDTRDDRRNRGPQPRALPVPKQDESELASRREKFAAEESGTTYHWYYSGAVLMGLFGLSVWILTTRVKSMDRLR